MAKDKELTPRDFMIMAVEAMKKSIPEDREDKTSPKVGAVLVSPDNKLMGTAYRGELRQGDHAEYTLMDRKFREQDLTGCTIYATLEPCAKGARKPPKCSCSERIVNARIAKVYIGIEDPDPKVDRKGIKHLQDKGVEVELFDRDLQKIIEKENEQFIKEAKIRAKKAKDEQEQPLTNLDTVAENTTIESFSDKALSWYLQKSGSNYSLGSQELINELLQLDLIKKNEDGSIVPTKNGIVLFGKKPRLQMPQVAVKAKVDYGNGQTDVQSFDDAIVLVPDQIESWLKKVLPESFDRTSFTREKVSAFPVEVLDEAIINALVHRDYDIEGAHIQLSITPDKITISSPGAPVSPITMEQMITFSAPSLKRNPKITYVFSEMGLVEETGFGMDTFRSVPEKYKLPLPLVEYNAPNIVFTFPRNIEGVKDSNDKLKDLTEDLLHAYEFVKLNKEVSRKEYEVAAGISEGIARRRLSALRKDDIIGDNGKDPGSKNFRYVFIG